MRSLFHRNLIIATIARNFSASKIDRESEKHAEKIQIPVQFVTEFYINRKLCHRVNIIIF